MKKNKRQKTGVFAGLILLFIFGISFYSQSYMNLYTSNTIQNNEIIQQIKQPKSSASEINITTPENSTYTGPMSGYYPATYGFENDQIGADPYGWTVSESASTSCNVIATKDNHKNVVEFWDNSNSGQALMENYFTAKTTGEVEFWISGQLGSVTTTNEVGIQLRNAAENYLVDIRFVWGPSYLYAAGANGGSWETLQSIVENHWYHLRIIFDSSISQYDVYIDGVLRGSNLNYKGGSSGDVESIVISTHSTQCENNMYMWVDAIGYSWDPDYSIGNNRKEGLLLSFDNATNLDWMGYSLDSQSNKTILGNATIPLPIEGLHTIQVAGNTTIGQYYQSDVRFFTVKLNPNITIISPENTTYTGPMSGYYPATYGFENDQIGADPYGWTVSESASTSCNVIATKDNHKNVVEFWDNSNSGQALMENYFTAKTTGEVEFWISGQLGSVTTTNEVGIQLRNAAENYLVDIRFVWGPSYLYAAGANGGSWETLQSIVENHWYHLRIIFDSSISQYDVYIDGVLRGSNLNYKGGSSGDVESIVISTHSTQCENNMYMWVDAIGYSWDPDYSIGNNRKEGLLLSFDNATNLDWMGYSLDSQSNKTILGNTTIPMPLSGLHTIQVFGNSTFGMIGQSQLKYFTIDMIPAHYITLNPGVTNYCDLISQSGIYIEFYSTELAYLEVIRTSANLASTQPGTQFSVYYFYSITVFDQFLNKNDSIIGSMKVRFYYDPATVKNENKLYILHYMFDIGENAWVWKSLEATLNKAENYLEVAITGLSVFCLAEIKGDTGNPFLIFFIENMWWIIILAAVGIAIPTIYTQTIKKKKGKVNSKISSKRKMDLLSKAEAKKEVLQRMWQPEQKIETQEFKPSAGQDISEKGAKFVKIAPKPKKVKKEKLVPVISMEDRIKYQKELEKTEKELIVDKQIDTCQVHKGQIFGVSYICQKCGTRYCLKCASTLSERNEVCWVCETPIELKGIKLDAEKLQDDLQVMVADSNLVKIFKQEKPIEELIKQKDIDLSILSKDFIERVNDIEWNLENKIQFLKEMMGLSYEEREKILTEIIEYQNFKKSKK